MQTVVLAAGQGTRIRPLSDRRPKPMLPVAGRPILEHVAEAAVDAGTDELVFVIGYEGTAVTDHFGDSFQGVPITYCEQPHPDGTADALAAANGHIDGRFAVLNGDNLYDPASVASLFERETGIGVHRVTEPSRYGVVEFDGGRATDIVEKPANPSSRYANVGAYVLPPDSLDELDVPRSERGEYELTDMLARLIRTDTVDVVEFDRWIDVGRPWDLLAANELLLSESTERLEGDVHESASFEGPVVVEEGARIRAGVVMEGPVLVTSGADVGPNAYVRGTTVLGNDARIGHGVEVKNSALFAGATVGHLSYVGDSVIGRDVNFGAGTVVANLRHDGQPVRAAVKDERVSTGRRKFGVVVGDEAKTGIDTSLNAGVTLSTGATTRPGETVLRDR